MSRAKPSVESEVRDLLTWVADARCHRYNPDLFDAPKRDRHGQLTPAKAAAVERAKEICMECPVMMQCLQHAVTYQCRDAVYGGLTDEERAEWANRELVAA